MNETSLRDFLFFHCLNTVTKNKRSGFPEVLVQLFQIQIKCHPVVTRFEIGFRRQTITAVVGHETI